MCNINMNKCDGGEVYMLVIIVSFCIWGCVWGIVTNKVIENKGYNENWFWWGFFFGFLALIVAATKPECHRDYSTEPSWMKTASPDRSILSQGGWICSCGRTNPSYTGTCACGATKDGSVSSKATTLAVSPTSVVTNQIELERLKKIESDALAKGGWRCRRCGKVNPEFIGFCSCGMTRGQSREIDQKYEKEEAQERDTNEATQSHSDLRDSEVKDKFEEIKKYNELLKSGIISQEEFSKKKKELLEL